jgi:cobalt/nickel transport system permease protein
MRHSFLDKYGDRDSFAHRRDARVKIVVVASVLVGLNVLRAPPWYVPAAAAAFLVTAVVAARLPFWYVFARAAAVLPFAVAIGIFLPFTTEGKPLTGLEVGELNVALYEAGLRLYVTLIVKAYLSLAWVTLLLATTPFDTLLKALSSFRAPAFLLALASFAYRYIFVFVGELERLQRAWAARYFGRRRLAQFLTLGPAVGALFVRSYERAERIWAAMLSRGYDPDAI